MAQRQKSIRKKRARGGGVAAVSYTAKWGGRQHDDDGVAVTLIYLKP